MLPSKIAFVDLETTGISTTRDRIIEIGIVRVEDGKIVKTFSSLINPSVYLPLEITRLTGIGQKSLENAPSFRQIGDEILETLKDTVFVAHNVRFDYGFLKSEYRRLNHVFRSKHFCTVRLSRILYPRMRRHNLDSIIEKFQIRCDNRHRALDDATVISEFYKKVLTSFKEEIIEKAVSFSIRRPTIPQALSHIAIDKIPESPGVYMFYGEDNALLYIGKSKNIKERVKSHFVADLENSSEMKISQQIRDIQWITTTGELSALFLESQMIKELLPLYNKKLRRLSELVILRQVEKKNGYLGLNIERGIEITPQILSDTSIVNVFKTQRQAKEYILSLCKSDNLCEKIMGLEKTNGACFQYRLDGCSGACIDKEKKAIYNLRFITAINKSRLKSWPYRGPILIEERVEEQTAYIVAYNWCIVGTIKMYEDSPEFTSTQSKSFDLDTYKILSSYFKESKNLKKIKVCTSAEIAELTSGQNLNL